jgi:hypothetical protein
MRNGDAILLDYGIGHNHKATVIMDPLSVAQAGLTSGWS